ncbi:MAG TPA: helix-turn-helix domain-containing protein [Rhizorhapis sp.]
MQFDSIDMIEGAVRRVLDTQKTSPWLDSGAAAEYLSCTAGTMKTWCSRGEGPRYHIIQQKLVRYHVDDLDAFVRGRSCDEL